jgi:hypothetical protein
MAWTIEQIMESASQSGKTLTREQAAFHTHCWNEAEKRNVHPLVVVMEYVDKYKAKENLGKANSDGPKKENWQL